MALAAARIFSARWYLADTSDRAEHARWWQGLGLFLVTCQSALWAVASLIFARSGTVLQEVVLHTVLYGVAMGAAMHLAGAPRVRTLYCVAVLVPLAGRDLAIGGNLHLLLAAVTTLALAYTFVIGHHQARIVAELLLERARSVDLLRNLEQEYRCSEQARSIAENAVLARTRFVAAANHDLRQPLNAMNLLLHSLRPPYRTETVGATLAHMQKCVDGMTDVVDALLDLTSIDAGETIVNVEPVRVDQIVADCVAVSKMSAVDKGLRLEFESNETWARSDRALLSRIVANLLSNAIRYTQTGSVSVSVTSNSETVQVSIKDTGRGIPKDLHDRVFDEFFQVANDQRDRELGLGLGLAIVKRLTTLLGHTVELESDLGVGSTFRVVLGPPQPRPSAVLVTSTNEQSQSVLAGRQMLVVEDDQESRGALRALLLSWGAYVEAVGTVDEMRMVLARGFRPDALIVDYRLSNGTTGLDAVRVVRQSLSTRVPALVISGDLTVAADPELRTEKLDVLQKPVKPAALRAFLVYALATRQQAL